METNQETAGVERPKTDTLIVYYSMTGNTKKAAERLAEHTMADLERLNDKCSYDGTRGKLKLILKSVFRTRAAIYKPEKDLSVYEKAVICTPVYNCSLAPAVRAYIVSHKDSLALKRVCLVTVSGGTSAEKAACEIEETLGAALAGKCSVYQDDIETGSYQQKLDEFAASKIFSQADSGTFAGE